MIHLVLREPLAYQQTLCRALNDAYPGSFVAWFAGRGEEPESEALASDTPFKYCFLSEVGYAKLHKELRADPEATVILGGWSSAIAFRTFLIAALSHVPVLVWADHPHPRRRNRLFDSLRTIYLRWLAGHAKAFLACGKPTVEHLAGLGIPRRKIFNFPYWVELPKEWSTPPHCAENETADKPLRLIAVGRHVPVKAFDVAIKAVKLANESAGRIIAELVLVGDGAERPHLERLAQSLGGNDFVSFAGWLDNKAVSKQLCEANALIVSSQFEAYGVVVLEALAHGRPVLASEKITSAIDKDDGFGAILFHPVKDVGVLAHQIKMLAEDQRLLKMSSTAARAIAEAWPPKRAAQILQSILEPDQSHDREKEPRPLIALRPGLAIGPVLSVPHSTARHSPLERFRRWRESGSRSEDARPPRVTGIQWGLASVTTIIAVASYEVSSYAVLALLTQVLCGLSFLLLIIVTRELLKTRTIGKFCLIGGTFIFYWLDALTLSTQENPFSIAEGFPINAAQFDQGLIQQALVYVAIFQLLLLAGYSIRPRFERTFQFVSARIDSLSFDRTLIAFLLVMCSIAPLLIYYDFDAGKIIAALLASRSGTDFDSPEPGLAQHVALFGIYGAALFFVYALKAATWRRFWWLALGVIAAAPFVMGGTRHIWLYISLPSVLIVLRGVKGQMSQKRVVALTVASLIILVVAQAQFVYRSAGWREVEGVPVEELSQFNTNGQLTALLFAEYLVPAHHAYFREFLEPYFLIHWVPRQVWPAKPVMESWTFYNDSYVEGAAFNVTPSAIGQFHLNWGLPGVMFIGLWLGFLTFLADRVLMLLNSDRQRAMFVVVGMFYAFIISSFRFYSPIYFSYFCFGVIAMFLLTRRRNPSSARLFQPRQIPA